uniref:Uncharacterized protein n=1 Tax=Ixodes ricinus TaxID=34613 RepID=A0A147BM37_IXORI
MRETHVAAVTVAAVAAVVNAVARSAQWRPAARQRRVAVVVVVVMIFPGVCCVCPIRRGLPSLPTGSGLSLPMYGMYGKRVEGKPID